MNSIKCQLSPKTCIQFIVEAKVMYKNVKDSKIKN